jgi:hypothetical protein
MVKKAKKKVKKLTEEEREEKKLEGELPSKKVRDVETKQILAFLVVVGLLFFSFLGVYYYLQSQKHFEFEGAEWLVEGEREGWSETLYHGRYPIIYGGKLYTNMNVWLRFDPRENNASSQIDFKKEGIGKNVIVTFDKEFASCSDRSLVIPLLSQIFGAGLPWTDISGAMSDKQRAEELSLAFADCSNASFDTTVFSIEKGDSSRLYSNNGCYVLEYSSCDDSLKLSEKMVLELIRQLNT